MSTSANVSGTFASGQSSNVGQLSSSLMIQSGQTTMSLSLSGSIDVNNTVKTQMSTDGQAWTDQTTYNSAQTKTAIAVATGQRWRLQIVSQQPITAMNYTLSSEN